MTDPAIIERMIKERSVAAKKERILVYHPSNWPHTPNRPAVEYTNEELVYEWERVDEKVGRIIAGVLGIVSRPLAEHRVALSIELTRRGITAAGHC